MFKKITKRVLSLVLKLIAKLQREKNFDNKDIKTVLILFMKPLGIGDLLMDTVSFKELRKKYKNANLTLLTDRDLLSRTKLFDEVKILSLKSAINYVRKNKFDLVILPNKNLKQSILAILTKKKYWIGYLDSWQIKSNFKLKYPKTYSQDMHYHDMAFNVLKNIDIKKRTWNMERIGFNKNEKNKVDNLVKTGRKVIVINPYVLWKSRTWPKDRYVALISKLIKEYFVIIVGGPDDLRYNKEFDENFNKHFLNLTGKLSIFELAALFNRSDLVITGDSGPMHIALTEAKKTLSLFGVTDPLTRLPIKRINKDVFYVYHKNKNEERYDLENEPKSCKAINSITVDEVYKKVKEIL